MNRIVEKVNFPIPKQPKAKRVAAYAMVSSGKDEMLHSLSAQISYYSELIQGHPGWLYCGVFSDEAYTGTKDNRTGFQSLISECRKGNIDLIITKSISRFARNTVTLLETVRALKLFGIDVFFEEQNIHTISADDELMMTILASYAQAESLSASENQKWRIRKAFENGEIVNLRFLFGYRINGAKIEIDPAQADIVREVFERAVNGESFTSIANDLNNRNITRCLGGKWNSQRIRDLLSNEKYLGNALLQKKYRNNHLEKKLIHNDGQLPKYYAEGTHDAIVDEELFAKAQDILCDLAKRRDTLKKSTLSAFSGMIVCDSTDKYKTVIWQCNRKFKDNTCCKTPHITEDEIKARFLKVYNGLISDKEPFIKACKLTRDVLTDTKEIDREMPELLRELEVVTELIKKCIAENSSSAQDQEKYTERYNNYVDRYEKAKSRYDEIEHQKENKLSKRKALDRFISELSKRDELLTEFDNCLWLTVADKVMVRNDGTLVFKFNDGTEIKG